MTTNPGGMFPNRIRAQDALLVPHIASFSAAGAVTAAQFLLDFQVTGSAPITMTLPTAAAISAQVALGGENPVNYVYEHFIDNQNTAITTFTTGAGTTPASFTVAASTKMKMQWRFDPTGLLLSQFNWLAPGSPAVSGGTVTSVATGTGLTGGPITGSGTVSLANIGPGAGTLVNVENVTLNAQGQVTASTSYPAGGPVTSISQGNSIVLTPNPITATGTVAVATSSIYVTLRSGATGGGGFLTFTATPAVIVGSDLTSTQLPTSTINVINSGTYRISFNVSTQALSGNLIGIYDQNTAAAISQVYGNLTLVNATPTFTLCSGEWMGPLVAGHAYSLRNLEGGTATYGVQTPTFPTGIIGAGSLVVERLA